MIIEEFLKNSKKKAIESGDDEDDEEETLDPQHVYMILGVGSTKTPAFSNTTLRGEEKPGDGGDTSADQDDEGYDCQELVKNPGDLAGSEIAEHIGKLNQPIIKTMVGRCFPILDHEKDFMMLQFDKKERNFKYFDDHWAQSGGNLFGIKKRSKEEKDMSHPNHKVYDWTWMRMSGDTPILFTFANKDDETKFKVFSKKHKFPLQEKSGYQFLADVERDQLRPKFDIKDPENEAEYPVFVYKVMKSLGHTIDYGEGDNCTSSYWTSKANDRTSGSRRYIYCTPYGTEVEGVTQRLPLKRGLNRIILLIGIWFLMAEK